ncbi:MAG: hypothetical protein M3Q33_02205 [Acidobacteriota bacterium]|nr:hypothetical protein [Acidobacteriota bacterium]
MMRFTVKTLFSIIGVITGASFAFGQTEPASVSLETILKNASAQNVVYEEEFKNLLAKETKTVEKYGKNGEVKKQNVIEANFVVYQSLRDKNIISEFRNIVKVDGKSVADSDKTPDEFFSQLPKTGSVEKELERVQKESSRYDKNLEIQGLTLLQAPVLSDNLRPYFDFQLIGTETIQGNEVLVVGYRQTKKSPFISVNEKDTKTNQLSLNFKLDVPGSLKKTGVFLRGKLWVDSKTFQLWREERELIAQTENPIVLLRTEFEYQPSDFGILVPKQISLEQYNVKKSSQKNPSTTAKDTKIAFDYSRFTKTNVEVKILDDDSQ